MGNWWEIDPSVMPPEEEPVVLLPEGDVVLPVGVGCRDSLARPDTDPALAWVPTVLLVGSLLTTSKSAETLAKSLGDHAHVHMAWCSPLLHTDNVLGYIHEAVATAVPSIVICTGVLCFGPGAVHVHPPPLRLTVRIRQGLLSRSPVHIGRLCFQTGSLGSTFARGSPSF